MLRTQAFGHLIRAYPRLPSTNTTASAWAAEGAPEGSVVYTEYQTAGRGRQGRTWHTSAGQNLTFSLILRPSLPLEHLGLITLCAGLAVAETVDAVTHPLTTQIKWPNDVLLEGRKCCGILLESAVATPTTTPQSTVILGIGLNINQADFPPELERRATSLLLETGHLIPRAPLFAQLLSRLENYYLTLGVAGGAAIRQAYVERLYGLNTSIELRRFDDEDPIRGILQGITETGALRLRTGQGIQVYNAGEVTTQYR